MLFRETVAVYYENQTKWTNALRVGKCRGFVFNVTADDRPTENNKWALNGYVKSLFEMMSSLSVCPSVESHTI